MILLCLFAVYLGVFLALFGIGLFLRMQHETASDVAWVAAFWPVLTLVLIAGLAFGEAPER